jgi:hypothetical protein
VQDSGPSNPHQVATTGVSDTALSAVELGSVGGTAVAATNIGMQAANSHQVSFVDRSSAALPHGDLAGGCSGLYFPNLGSVNSSSMPDHTGS